MPKDLCSLSKRRKNQLISSRINFYKNYIKCDSTHQSTSYTSTRENLNNESSISSKYISQNFPNIKENCEEIEQNVVSLNSTFLENNYFSSEYRSLNSPSNIKENCGENSLINIDEISISHTLSSKLQSWMIEEQIRHKAGNALLKILRDCGHNLLPKDIRTLMQTERKVTQQIKKMDNGFYVHFGLLHGLQRLMERYCKEICSNSVIKLLINCDGMSLTKSSGSQFWPILVSIYTDIRTEPFPVGVYHGFSKPKNANNYLNDFINEMTEIHRNGFLYNDKLYKVSIAGIVCDAPARAFITYTKSHSGYFSCSKCTQEGDYIKSVIFPELEFTLRTNESFRRKEQEDHHTGVSVLEKLEIDMVNQIALDYMHTVCLGIMKRLLLFWVKGSKNIRLHVQQQERINNALLAVRFSIPLEFARLPRSLKEVDKWKATEFRLFLLYIGPVILKSAMSNEYYTHFLTLSVAIRILCHPELCIKINDYAHNLLVYFVDNFKNLYGPEYMSYNVHNLLHLANDVKTFGSLDKFSCFQFENYLRSIRKRIKNSGKPLEQLINRINEETKFPVKKKSVKLYPRVCYSKSGKIKLVQFKEFTITNKSPNNCCLLKDNSFLIVKEIIFSNKILHVVGHQFSKIEPLFVQPCNSLNLQISVVDKDFTNITIPISEIKTKCVKIVYLECTKLVFVPLIHH